MRPERYAPHFPLPLVAFVPGRAGSKRPAHGGSSIDARPLPPDRWRENEAWLYGVDLWNSGFLWEAHESWESIWRIPHDREQAEFLRGLIQCAAAGLKLAIGNASSARNLSSAGLTKLIGVQSQTDGSYMGLDVRSFTSAFRAFVVSPSTSIEGCPLIQLG